MKIDNMRLEHQEKLIKDAENEAARQRQQEAEEEKLAAKEAAAEKPAKEVGFIAVSVGEGLTDIFEGLGVDYLIEGGQTMNPSTEDMLNAIEQVNAKNIFILPNNKNIILAAEQARDLTEDKKIIVLPTKTIPQGISAMIGYMPEAGVDENEENMKETIRFLKEHDIHPAQVNLLPYHNTGSSKYPKLDMEYKGNDLNAPTKEEMEGFVKLFQEAGFSNTKIGG